jgi:hypothetical protein
MFFNNNGGRSQISVSTSQEACRRLFSTMMVGAFGSLSTPPKGTAADMLLSIDGGHSRISGTVW